MCFHYNYSVTKRLLAPATIQRVVYKKKLKDWSAAESMALACKSSASRQVAPASTITCSDRTLPSASLAGRWRPAPARRVPHHSEGSGMGRGERNVEEREVSDRALHHRGT